MNAQAPSDELAALHARRAELLDARGACSRAFGEARRAGEDLQPLKTQMQALTSELKAVDAQLEALVTDDPPAGEPSPAEQDTPARSAARPLFPDAARPSSDPIGIEDNISPEAWDHYVSGHPRARVSHLFSIGAAIRASGAVSVHRAVARQGERVVGVAATARLRTRLFGDYLVSMPWLNYGGPLGDSAEIENALAAHLDAIRNELGCGHLELRDEVERTGPMRTDKITMELDLPGTTDALHRAYGTKLRAQIRRGARENLQLRVGGLELLEDYYRVFSENMRDLGTPIHPRSFFREIFNAVPERSWLVLVYHQSRPVSCAFLHGLGDTLEIPWASTVRSANRLSANMFLYGGVLDFAVEQGFGRFDFGRCSRDSSTRAFKAQWGATERQLYWHYGLPEGGELPALNPHNPRYALMIAIWQRLPVWLVNQIGPALIRGLP